MVHEAAKVERTEDRVLGTVTRTQLLEGFQDQVIKRNEALERKSVFMVMGKFVTTTVQVTALSFPCPVLRFMLKW